jgi:hypothetical protein
MTVTARIYHLELDDDDGAGPIEGTAMILIKDDAVAPEAAAAGAGEVKRRARFTVPRAAVGTMLNAARRIDADAVLDALPNVITAQGG